MDNNFLAVNKEYLGLGLKSVDLLIISQIEEFERTTGQCYVTNKQFKDMFGESESTIKRALDKLEDLNIVHRDTKFVEGNGKASRQRTLSLNSRSKWKVQNEPSIQMVGSNIEMVGSNVDNGRFKNEEWKVHNEPIKEKVKDNIKENIKENISFKFPVKKKNYESFSWKDKSKIYDEYCDFAGESTLAEKYDTTVEVIEKIIREIEYDEALVH